MTTSIAFFGDKLRVARLLNGMTQQELGEQISVTRQFVHQLESDARRPAEDVLLAICEVLGVDKEFFARPSSNEVKLEQCHFRKRKTTPAAVANRTLAFSTVLEWIVEYIDQYLELPNVNIPQVDCRLASYSYSQIAEAALACRSLWGLSMGPISNISRVLENAGIIITQYSEVSDKVDALSINRKFPIIVRNHAKESPCRLRFDLAHELGHLVLHNGIETGDNITEREADKFASEFIFPRAAFLTEFPNLNGKRINWQLIYRLKLKWGLSARAIVYKAHENKLINAQQFRGANVWLNKSGQSKVEKYDEKLGLEEPELLSNAFSVLNEELGIHFAKVAKNLHISEKMLSNVVGFDQSVDSIENNILPFFRSH